MVLRCVDIETLPFGKSTSGLRPADHNTNSECLARVNLPEILGVDLVSRAQETGSR